MSKNNTLYYKEAIKYIWHIIKPYKFFYIVPSLIVLILVATGLMQAKATQLLIDSTVTRDKSLMTITLCVFLVLIIINTLLTYIKGICISKLSYHAGKELKNKIAKQILYAQYGKLIKLQAGDTIQTLNSDTEAVCSFIGGELINLLSQFTMALGGLVYLICINPLLALVTFAYTPIGMFFTLTLNSKMNRQYPVRSDREGQALSVVEQVLGSIPVIKSFIAEKQTKEKIYGQYLKVFETEMKISKWNALIQTACSSTAMLPRIIYLIFAGYLVVNSKLTIGNFTAVYDLISYIIGPTVYFPFLLNGLNRSIASIYRISKLNELQSTNIIVQKERIGVPEIQIKNLYFSYEGAGKLINGISFRHRGPGIIALCGKSGSGKTTLIDLIAGLYKPDKGEIEHVGTVAVVSQDTYIFNEDIFENVRTAKPEASDEEVREALLQAGAEAFIDGDRGFTDLSGGEKQRISLARAIIAGAEIWLLDEPTSALDVVTEKIIIDTIKTHSKDKLILISAHREALIELAERRINL